MRVCASLFLMVALASTCPLHAGFTVFLGNSAQGTQDTARDTFLSRPGSLSFEGFNTEFAIANSVDFPVGSPKAFTVANRPGAFVISDATDFLTSEGTRNLRLDLFSEETATFTFSSPINAFGFDINDVDRIFNGIPTVLDYSDASGNVVEGFARADIAENNDFFFGIVSDTPFTHFSITQKGFAGEALGFDRMYYGNLATVPEPSGVALWYLTFAFLCVRRRSQ